MDPRLAANIEAYRSPEALERYTSHYGLQPIEKVLIDQYFSPATRVLDLACGAGRTTVPLHERGHDVIGMDLSEPLIEFARNRFPQIDFRVGTYCELPFERGSFGAILISYNGLDYACPESQRRRALEECARVLRPDGHLIFSTHNVKSLHCSPYYLRHPRRAAWMLRHAATAFKSAAYVEDLNAQWTFFGSSEYVATEAQGAGMRVIDVMGFRYSRNALFNTICSPWLHYVCVPG